MSKLKVLVAHNAYQLRGGEDAVFEAEVELLRRNGHEVVLYTRSNFGLSSSDALRVVAGALWSVRTIKEFNAAIASDPPDIVHVHNTFPLISPSIYWASAAASIPIVQTLHNFRLLCPQAMLLREGRICEDCVGAVPWRGVVRKCYRSSVGQSALVAASTFSHRMLGTWREKVSRYIALNEFCKSKFIEGGLPAELISVKPNFVDFDGNALDRARAGFLFVGRLSIEKGVETLLDAAELLTGRARVSVVGAGPLSHRVAECQHVDWLGELPTAGVRASMASAVALLMPSIWYENFPRTLVESFACGLPVIASRIGALAELIEDGVTGLLFEPGDPSDLAAKMRWGEDHPQEMAKMSAACRRQYERFYAGPENYSMLMGIYKKALSVPL